MPFKVIKVTDVWTNRKSVCDFLLVINTKWYPISYRFEVIADYCLNVTDTLVLSPLGGLGKTYAVHLRLVGKLVVNLLFVIIELFLLGNTAEVLGAEIYWKSAFLNGVGQLPANFREKRTSPPIIFGRIVKPINALQPCRWQFSHTETL